MARTLQPALAPVSIDRARVIRQSMRCLFFGVIGLIPVVGAGLAVQALRLRSSVSAALGESWKPPPVTLYWILGLVALYGIDRWAGLLGAFAVVFVMTVVQSWHVWRSYTSAPEAAWNPGRGVLLWGMTLAYAGLSGTIWVLGILILLVRRSL